MEVQIAYFSAEFGIDESLPIYSGGLGVLAGDYVKAANELNMPLAGVGILYRKGYFQQRIREDGRQEAMYPQLHPDNLPIQPVLNGTGHPLLVEVPIEQRVVFLRVWVVQVGRIPVYLLDANHENNSEADRHLTDRLYGGHKEERICHEIILGIGGVRALRAVGITPRAWHLNEGHPAFSILERIREYCAQGLAFSTALEAVKSTTIFTTHTPVPAGHDVFSFSLMDRFLADFYPQLCTTRDKVLSLGAVKGDFNLTRLAQNGSCKVNGVSKLHAEVTKELFHEWTPMIPAQDLNIESITNGVHTRTWLAPELKNLFDRYFDCDWLAKVDLPQVWQRVDEIADDELWQAHQESKFRALKELGLPLHPDILVMGFARRFATYKRATYILEDLDRLERIVNRRDRPVCLVFAGKAHPNDQAGQDLIHRIVTLSRTESFHQRLFFLENYDLKMARHLVQGVDVWLNTPVKPMEASGTSGQKAGLNGVLNLSILDGWWPEGYNGRNGWAIHNQEELYQLLETSVTFEYYARGQDGLSPHWIRRMKESIKSIGPAFSAQRMAREYWDGLYKPTLKRGSRFLAHGCETARRVADYKRFMRESWPQVRIENRNLHPLMDDPQGSVMKVEAVVQLGGIWYRDVRVEAVGSNGQGGIWHLNLDFVGQTAEGLFRYEGDYSGSLDTWQQEHANIRVYPVSEDFAHDFELELVTWGESPY